MVIGTFAYCGSGQDTLADGFCKYKKFKKISLGDVIRNIADARNLPHERIILQSIREECDAKYGRNYIPEIIVDQVKRLRDYNIILTGIRTMEEFEIFKIELNMFLMFVYADENIRLNRMLKRAEQKDEKSFELLKLRMDKELILFDYGTLKRNADYIYNFNMQLSDYVLNESRIICSLYREIKLKMEGKKS